MPRNPREAVRRAARRATAGQRPLPDFLVIGEAKCGTTSLFEYLCEHPLVCRPATKEVRFFALHFDRGEHWYRAFFPTWWERRRVARARGAATLTGEATPMYLSHPAVPGRVASLLPDVKLIALLRDPVDRAISTYHFRVKVGVEHRPLREAIADSLLLAERGAGQPSDDMTAYLERRDYVSRGEYARPLRRWHEHFDPAQLLVVETGRLSRGGGSGFQRVLDHLGLPRWHPSVFPEHNVGEYGPGEPELRAALARHYAPHNAELRQLLGVDWAWNESGGVTP